MMEEQEQNEGKGFGGGEATRNPDATDIDLDKNPKAKQTAIHKASSFEDYMKSRQNKQPGQK